MRFLVMLVFLCLGHDLSTGWALVVAPGAPDFMDTEFGDVYFFLAGAASLRCYWSFW